MKETHRNIKFWTVTTYNEWLLKPAAQSGVFGKESYLEEENGDPVSDRRLSDIRDQIRKGWAKLINIGHAPRVWGELDQTGRDTFHKAIKEKFPLFKCAKHGWKLDRIARLSYSAWHRRHVDQDKKWFKTADKKKRKLEVEGKLKGKGKASKKLKGKALAKFELLLVIILPVDLKEKLETLLSPADAIPFDTNSGAGPSSTDTNTAADLDALDTNSAGENTTRDTTNTFEPENSTLNLYDTHSAGSPAMNNIPIDPTLDPLDSNTVNTNPSPAAPDGVNTDLGGMFLDSLDSNTVNTNPPPAALDGVNTDLGGTNTSNSDIIVHRNIL